MTKVIEKKKKYTYEDYVMMSDDKRYELIEGELLMTPSPTTGHQRILRKLEFLLEKFVNEKNLGEIFFTPCDVYLDEGNVVQPDIMFISKERLNIIGEKNIQGAPCITIEIISKSSAYRDMVQKKKLYAQFGVKEYWIVIPEDESIEIYLLDNTAYKLFKIYRDNDIIETPGLKGFNKRLKNIF
ncbi:MAG: Uma2 family endonuclease [Candidatus Scalindua sp.]|nr:Uma2 family endonuclease [Candidatus Scalindua sp.]